MKSKSAAGSIFIDSKEMYEAEITFHFVSFVSKQRPQEAVNAVYETSLVHDTSVFIERREHPSAK